jgi:MFS family permease
LTAALALLASPFIALLPAVARSLTDGSGHHVASATALLTTSQGIGAVVGALAVAPLAVRFGRGRLLVLDLVAVCVGLIAYAQARSLVVAAVALTVVGALYLGVLSGLSTVVQLRAPDIYRGRILSIHLVALGVLYPVGALVQGPMADVIGLRTTTTITAGTLLVVLTVIVIRRPQVLGVLGLDRSVGPSALLDADRPQVRGVLDTGRPPSGHPGRPDVADNVVALIPTPGKIGR